MINDHYIARTAEAHAFNVSTGISVCSIALMCVFLRRPIILTVILNLKFIKMPFYLKLFNVV